MQPILWINIYKYTIYEISRIIIWSLHYCDILHVTTLCLYPHVQCALSIMRIELEANPGNFFPSTRIHTTIFQALSDQLYRVVEGTFEPGTRGVRWTSLQKIGGQYLLVDGNGIHVRLSATNDGMSRVRTSNEMWFALSLSLLHWPVVSQFLHIGRAAFLLWMWSQEQGVYRSQECHWMGA